MALTLIPYTPDHQAAVLAVWNAATGGALPLTPALWRQNVAGDPLFVPDDCLIALDGGGGVAGFALTRTLPLTEIAANPDMGSAADAGYIMALAVHPRAQRQGHGSALLAAAEARLRAQGATRLRLGGGPPGHLVPGPPVTAAGSGFWERRGYTVDHITHDLRRSLDAWPPVPPAAVVAGEFTYGQGQPGDEAAILAFLRRAFPGGWRYSVARFFAGGYAPQDLTLLRDRAGAIQGFLCTYHAGSRWLGAPVAWHPLLRPGAWGGIGPLGIAPEVRGHGLGLALVAAGADYLYRQGVRDCVIDWTQLVDFYGRLGFGVWKSYYILKRSATNDRLTDGSANG